VMVDFRNLYAPDDVGAHGIAYFSLGRPETGLTTPGGAQVTRLTGTALKAVD